MEHPAVAEAGVIGKPDPVIGELVKAFVSSNRGYSRMINCAWSCLALPARSSGQPWRPRRSRSRTTSRRRAVARSCDAC